MAISINDIDYTTLTTAERLTLAQRLLDSVLYETHAPFNSEQMAALDAHLDEVEAGKAAFEPWNDARTRLFVEK